MSILDTVRKVYLNLSSRFPMSNVKMRREFRERNMNDSYITTVYRMVNDKFPESMRRQKIVKGVRTSSYVWHSLIMVV